MRSEQDSAIRSQEKEHLTSLYFNYYNFTIKKNHLPIPTLGAFQLRPPGEEEPSPKGKPLGEASVPSCARFMKKLKAPEDDAR